MAKRLSLDEKLAAVRRLRDEEDPAALITELRASLGDRSNLVVAAAAAVVGERGLAELAPALGAAFDQFLKDPLKNDKLCRAKIAIVHALDRLEHDESPTFLKAARHVQLEPVYGGTTDTAAPLRAAAVFALARIGGPRLLPVFTDALTDPEKDVRIAAAQALACQNGECPSLLLRLKARLGDPEGEVLSECFLGLLQLDPEEYLPFVAGHLDDERPGMNEAAVLALGRSRLPQAFEALRAFSDRLIEPGLRETVLLAISMIRLPAALDFLIERLRDGAEPIALAALTALKIHAHDPRLRDRIGEVVDRRKLPALSRRYDQAFSPRD
jgi:HEAT repeat protein